MGQIYNFKCNCGYKKTAAIGEGKTGMMLEVIREMFSSDELSEFEETLKGSMPNYYHGKMLAYCFACRELMSAQKLRYVAGGMTKIIIKPCEICGEPLHPCDTRITVSCPVCADTLSAEEAGLWD